MRIRHAMPLVLCALAACGARRTSRSPFPTGTLRVKGRPLIVEVAWNEELRVRGYRFRKEVKPGEGMVFLFPESSYLVFEMTDTPVPLSIAFAAREGEILQIEDMKPFDTRKYYSLRRAQVALEVPQGWFRQCGIQKGDRIEGLEALFAKFSPR